ncbi:MAG: peptidylprolyl isomerase [Luteolibacter sp.]
MIRKFPILLLPLFIASTSLSAPVEVNGMAATVNGSVITKNEVSFLLAPVYAQMITQFPRGGPEFEKRMEDSRKKILDELIDRRIILDEFKQLGASINPRLIDQEIDRQIRELYNGDKSRFNEELKKSRLTMPGYRELTHEKMVVQAMRAQQFADAPPPLPNEIQKEYNVLKVDMRDKSKDKITFRKIFIPATDPESPLNTPEDQLVLAEEIAAKLKKGADFAEAAKKSSRDAFADDGGYQKDLPRVDLSPEFATIVFEAPVGKIVGPLRDPRGFTIVKVESKNLGPAPPLSEVRPMVEERVRRKKTSAQYERWIKARRKNAMIDIK